MLVNYKGRPWMKGCTENPGLLYSLALCVAGVVVAAWELIPVLNNTLGLVPLPDERMRYTLLGIIGVTLLGSFAWDRLCLAVFAPRIFASQLQVDARSTSRLDERTRRPSSPAIPARCAAAALPWRHCRLIARAQRGRRRRAARVRRTMRVRRTDTRPVW